MRRPYVLGDQDDAMQVVWHHHKGIQSDIHEVARDFAPTAHHYFTVCVCSHLAAIDFSK
jgi:hypothetical protein